MPGESSQLAQFIVDLQGERISDEIRWRLRQLVLDSVACGFLGTQQTCYRIALRVMSKLAADGAAHVFGYPDCIDPARASLLNGVAIGALECDHVGPGTHAGGVVVPAVFALGEAIGASGDAVIRALLAGYEVHSRVSAAQTHLSISERGFHSPGISGPFGSAAGCSVLLGLSHEQTVAALGIASSHSAGLNEYLSNGAMTKRFHLGRAAQMGLESALLAQEGFTGPSAVFEGRYGYLQAYSPKPEAHHLVDDLGSQWYFEQIRVKPFPGCWVAQPFIPVLDLWHSKGIDPSAIKAIRVNTSVQGTQEPYRSPSLASVLGAQYSLPAMIAIVLARGSEGLVDLSEKTLSDPLIVQLSSQVRVDEDNRFHGSVIDVGGEIRIEVDGTSELLEAPGIPPSTPEQMQLLCHLKLERYLRDLVPPEQIAKISALIERLDDLGDIAELAETIFSS